jgi:magnesium chelatase family protein
VLASVTTFALEGVRSREVTVEVDARSGLEVFTLVGLPDRAIRESRERVRAALLNSELEFPKLRLTVNLAPADLRKEGPGFDLAIAVGVMLASGQVPVDSLEGCAVWGELSLSGELRPVRGALIAALGAREAGRRRIVVPLENGPEAALVDGLEVIGVPTLGRLADVVHGRWQPEPAEPLPPVAPVTREQDFADVRGQADAKRALEIAAAGGHNLLMVGPPGAGKTMLARRLPGILPPPTFEEALEITRIESAAGIGGRSLATERPFRAPHHTTSPQGLVGGGPTPRPGEITLAHRGVLFLDELAEFKRDALDALRQPLEDGRVEIVRGQRMLEFPSRAMLVGASNPCPCAKPADRCTCGQAERARYQRRMSGPLLDRIDLVCQVEAVPLLDLVGTKRTVEASSVEIRERVVAARARQLARLGGTRFACNAELDAPTIRRVVQVDPELRQRLLVGAGRPDLSGRGHDRMLRVARTIADLEGCEQVAERHLEEALGYRVSGWDDLAA